MTYKTEELLEAYCPECNEVNEHAFVLYSDGEPCEGEWLGECYRGHALNEAHLTPDGAKKRDYGIGRVCNCLTNGCYEPVD